jgi:decaprenylphospho-beta-D-ribofuranose 2-oxidase
MRLANWGNYPTIEATVETCATTDELCSTLAGLKETIARGLGRCYGDSSLNNTVLSTLGLNQVLAFDAESGLITCEAGISFAEMLREIVPQGWFLPVTPGTKWVTLGGAIASDIHGKNHHVEGSLSKFVSAVKLLLADGSQVRCSPEEHPDLFWATCGGMGLTGIILEATLSLKRIETVYIRQETLKARNLEELFALFETGSSPRYSVAWMDGLARGENVGRGLLIQGEHLPVADLPQSLSHQDPLKRPECSSFTVPFPVPSGVLNRFTVKAFNTLYYHRQQAKQSTRIVSYEPFFYPLDALGHWNRLYGSRGFMQYQFVLPWTTSHEGLRQILKRIEECGESAFLVVLKVMGEKTGILSFPMAGYTMALDFPITPGLFPLLMELDALVTDYSGRVYLSKDARMSEHTFTAGYAADIERFKAIKKRYDPDGRFQSIQSKRIGL